MWRQIESSSIYDTLSQLDIESNDMSLAAISYAMQSGKLTNDWVAEVELVHFEARLDHLCLHCFDETLLAANERRAFFEFLSESLGDSKCQLDEVSGRAFLSSSAAMETAAVPAAEVDGLPPDEFLPAADQRFDQIQAELQMTLHDCELNQLREAQGKPAVNATWIWGGGSRRDDGDTESVVVADLGTASEEIQRLCARLEDGSLESALIVLGTSRAVSLSASDRWKFWRNHLPAET